MSKALQQILVALPTLTQEELEQVKAKVAAAMSVSTALTPAAPSDDWLLQGIARVLRVRGLLRGDFMAVDPKTREAADNIQAALLAGVGRPVSELEKTALGGIAANALADYLSSWATLGPRIMLQSVPNALVALDAAFPGYLAAGMIGVLLRHVRTPE